MIALACYALMATGLLLPIALLGLSARLNEWAEIEREKDSNGEP